MVRISPRGVAKLKSLIKDVQYLYLRLDRELQKHLVYLTNSLLSVNLFEKEVAQLAYIIYVFDNLLGILRSLIRIPYVSSENSFHISSVFDDINPEFLLHSLSLSTFHRNVMVVRVPEVSYNLPQYIVLKSTLVELYKILCKIFESINRLIQYQPWLEDMRNLISNMINFLNNILTKTFLACVKDIPIELAKRLVQHLNATNVRYYIKELISYLDNLKNIQTTLLSLERYMTEKESIVRLSYIVSASRLYEMYILLLLLAILRRIYRFNGVTEHCDATCFSFSDPTGNRLVKVAYNQRNSLIEKTRLVKVFRILRSHERYLSNILKYTGIPDIVLYVRSHDVNMHIIFECKYRFNINSIVESRFKVLGYLLEYDINSAVLVFPRITTFSKRGMVDNEVYINHALIREACNNGVVMEYNGKLGKYLYLICIDPEDVDNGMYVLEKVLKLLGIIQ